MIKINTPNDLIFKEIENDPFLVELINDINKRLTDLDSLPNDGIKFEIVTEDFISIRQKNLLIYAFSNHGWSLSINIIGRVKEKEIHYNIFIIEEKKIYLN